MENLTHPTACPELAEGGGPGRGLIRVKHDILLRKHAIKIASFHACAIQKHY